MAGHSHWARIKRKKAVIDARRGKVFSKQAKVIMTAARNGGSDPSMNLSLRYAIDKAKAMNMTNDAIDRAVKKGAGEGDSTTRFEEVVYEGFGPGGVAVFIEGLTDNRNRTAGEVRKIFDMQGCSLAGPNSVAWMFEKKGVISVPGTATTEEDLFMIAAEAGAEDVAPTDDGFEITCEPATFEPVRAALAEKGIEAASADFSMIPKNNVEVDAEVGGKVMRLIEALEEHDDITNVYANMELSKEALAELEQ
ncbi:MAG: putative transcriptional regulatory protein [Phycisphaerae bacterium]|nr:putative transcriptional regulatory protein [Phycisphaerae bacterium]